LDETERCEPRYRFARRAARGDVRFAAQPSRHAETTPGGLYRRGYAGELTNFAGVDAPYEKRSDADRRLETVDSDRADDARRMVDALELRVRLREWRRA
jgi:adenylylsulfate kinase-like enzyme